MVRPASRLHLLAEIEANSFFFHLALGHAGEHGTYESRHDLAGILDDGGFHFPHVGQGLGHFQPDEASADDDRAFDLAIGHQFLDGLGVVEVGRRVHHGQIRAGNGQAPGAASRSQNQPVIGQRIGGAILPTNMDLPVFPVDALDAGPGEHFDILAILEKGFVAQHVEAGFAQIVDIADIAGNVKGNAAPAVGDKAILIDDGDL